MVFQGPGLFGHRLSFIVYSREILTSFTSTEMAFSVKIVQNAMKLAILSPAIPSLIYPRDRCDPFAHKNALAFTGSTRPLLAERGTCS